MNLLNYQAGIFYYIRKKAFHLAQMLCQEAYQKFDEKMMKVWSAYCYWQLGDNSQFLSQISDLEGCFEVDVCVERLKEIYQNKKEENVRGLKWLNKGDFVTVNLCFLEYFQNNFKELNQIIKQSKISHFMTENLKALILLDKNDYIIQEDSFVQDQIKTSLDKSMDLKSLNCFGLICQIEFFKKQRNFTLMQQAAKDLENQSFFDSIIILEKADQAIMAQKWVYLQDLIKSLIEKEPHNIIALKFQLLEILITSGDSTQASEILNKIISTIEKYYWGNTIFHILEVSLLINSVAANHHTLLHTNITLLKKTLSIYKDNYEIAKQLGYSYLLSGDYENAEKIYNQAAKINSESTDPLISLVQVKLYKDELEDSEANLEFIKEILSTLEEERSDYYFMQAVLMFKKAEREQNEEIKEEYNKESKENFNTALNIHIEKTKNLPNNFDFFKIFNPGYLLLLTEFFMTDFEISFTLKKYQIPQASISEFILQKCGKILSIILKKIPGLIAGYLLLVKANILNENYSQAQMYVQQVLDRDCHNYEAHCYNLYIALIEDLQNKTSTTSSQALQKSLSQNFELLNLPEFLLYKSQTEYLQKNYEDAQKSLEKALGLLEKQKNIKQIIKIEILTNLAILCAKMNDGSRAKQLIQECIVEYFDSKHKSLLMLANCEINIFNNDVKTAIDILKNVDQNDNCFQIAKIKLADIYLNNIKQAKAYTLCYEEIVEQKRNKKNLLLLAKAYSNVQEWNKALNVYNEIDKNFESNENIAKKIGQCYLKMFNYIKAQQFLEEKCQEYPECISLKIQHGYLLIKLRKHAEVREMFSSFSDQINLEQLEFQEKKTELKKYVEVNDLLFHNYYCKFRKSRQEEDIQIAIKHLQQVIRFKQQFQEILKANNLDVNQDRRELSLYHFQMVNLYQEARTNFEDVQNNLEAFIKLDPENIEFQLYYAEINYLLGETEKAKEQLRMIFKQDFSNQKAVQIYADCLLSQGQLVNGMKGFQKMLNKEQSTYNRYSILGVLIWFYRNSGKLNIFKERLENFKKQFTQQQNPTLAYCEGMLYYFIRNYNKALEHLLIAKQSSLYKDQVNLILIDIYLHDDNYLLYSNFFHREKFKQVEEKYQVVLEGLIEELSQNEFAQEKILYSIILEQIRNPQNTQHCIDKFEEFSQNKFYEVHQSLLHYYLVIWAMKMKQKNEVKKFLINIRNQKYFPKKLNDEYFFKAQILCVDVLINKDKFKAAQQLLEKVLAVNKSQILAYDYLIILNEKQKLNQQKVYEEAFQLTCQLDPNMGYNLAEQLFLNGNMIESFKICKQVLENYPKFVKIQKDILNPVKNQLLKNN